MPTWVAWSGVIGTFVFGPITVLGYVKYLLDKKVYEAHRAHLLATRNELRAMRAMMTEAIDNKEIVKGESERGFIRTMAYQLVAVEQHIDAMLGQEPNRSS
jgi:hypothetical protein